MRKGPPAKKIYRAPALRVYGDIRQLTFANANSVGMQDSMGGSANQKT